MYRHKYKLWCTLGFTGNRGNFPILKKSNYFLDTTSTIIHVFAFHSKLLRLKEINRIKKKMQPILYQKTFLVA